MIKLLRSFVCLIQTLSVAFVLLVGAGALPVGAAIGSAVSGSSVGSANAAAIAQLADKFNRQLHPHEKVLIRNNSG